MAIRAIIWDMGGVLVRTEDYRPRDQLAKRYGMTRQEIEELVYGREAGKRAQRGEVSFEEHWQYLARELSLSPAKVKEFQQAFWGGDKVDFELINLIRSLRGSYKIGMLSNAFSDLRLMVEDVWKIADAFDALVISAEAGVIKPDARIYQIMLERLDVEAQEAVFIDDFQNNIVAAQELNMHAIHFLNPAQALAELEALLKENSHG